MKTNKQNPDFLQLGHKILQWYSVHGRDLPFRKTKDPYRIWICEIIFQQTRIQQGMEHYLKFIERFPKVETLANADLEEVLLYWKGLGYYSRAINIHKAAQQIMTEFQGVFPQVYDDILKLKGVGKYTAAAVSSICYAKDLPAIDGNFYRVLSRALADDFEISQSRAFDYYTELALKLMPPTKGGDFNQAIMDLGSEICKPKNPACENCPINMECIAFNLGQIDRFPVKKKKAKPKELLLTYYFITHENDFLIQQRGDDFIWKKLFEFPTELPDDLLDSIQKSKTVKHQLTHKNMDISFHHVKVESKMIFNDLAKEKDYIITDFQASQQRSFPKPLQNYVLSDFAP